jgi:hypothetical protein
MKKRMFPATDTGTDSVQRKKNDGGTSVKVGGAHSTGSFAAKTKKAIK